MFYQLFDELDIFLIKKTLQVVNPSYGLLSYCSVTILLTWLNHGFLGPILVTLW